MSTPKFTPGPWLVRMIHFSSGNATPAVSHGDTSAYMCWLNLSGAYGGHAGLDRARADAHLIAAAPELYAALESLVGHADLGEVDFEPEELAALNAARAALAKARGEA